MRGSGMSARAGARRSRKATRTTLRLALLAVVTAVAAAIVVPALASAESGAADTARPPHTDASARSDAPGGPDEATTARVAAYVAAVQAARQRDAVIAYVAAKQRAAIAAYIGGAQQAQQHHASASHRATRSSGSTTVSSSGGGGFLACVRQRESHGNYAAVNGRSGTAGAYQFMPSTWNNTARSAGRPDLVGVNPAAASPASQDAMAQALYASQGRAPWSGNGC